MDKEFLHNDEKADILVDLISAIFPDVQAHQSKDYLTFSWGGSNKSFLWNTINDSHLAFERIAVDVCNYFTAQVIQVVSDEVCEKYKVLIHDRKEEI